MIRKLENFVTIEKKKKKMMMMIMLLVEVYQTKVNHMYCIATTTYPLHDIGKEAFIPVEQVLKLVRILIAEGKL